MSIDGPWISRKKSKSRYFESLKDSGIPFVPHRGLESPQSTGRIAIHVGNVFGPQLGYLNVHQLVETKKDAILHSYTALGSVIDIYDDVTEERLCLTTGYDANSVDLNPESINFHLPCLTDIITAPGDVPHSDKYSHKYLETSIFSLDRMTNEILVNWVNGDGSYPLTHVVLHNNNILFSGDFLLLRERLQNNLDPVVFRWVESD
ncbi:hypothetical protein GYMLUDRAFT_237654 [Collybiopsis luxurians FD-317 M1]|nr:hypothetical protein GYMLUDRAFT_237654 [Collybiopsis luxurians FD-317 M1]